MLCFAVFVRYASINVRFAFVLFATFDGRPAPPWPLGAGSTRPRLDGPPSIQLAQDGPRRGDFY